MDVKNKETHIPSVSELNEELRRVNSRSRSRRLLRRSAGTLVVVSATVVLISILLMPILRINGNSMTPTLNEGEIVASVKISHIKRGDVVGVRYGTKVLVKRCIALEYQWINIDMDGNVYVDGELIEEPYLSEKAFGDCNLKLPYQVPEGCFFVMGDHRETSIDSRNTSIGCISKEKIVGRVFFRVWPLNKIGSLRNDNN